MIGNSQRTTSPGLPAAVWVRGLGVLLTIALSLGAAFAVAAYLYVALSRFRYPFELEWMEGQSLIQVQRIGAGLPLYTAPSLAYVPFIYPPLYYALAAGFAAFGGGFAPLRLVSILASLACFALIFAYVRRETGARLPAVLAVGLFAATYRLGGAWLDLGRVDTLLLAFLLGALLLLHRETTRTAAGAGLLFALAFLTKQTAWIAVLPLAFDCLWRSRARALALLGTAVAVGGGATIILDWRSGGWYRFYTLALPSHHTVTTMPEALLAFWRADILTPLPIAAALAAIALWPARRAWARWGRYASLAGGFLGLSWAARLNDGSYDNVLLPACAALAILAAIGLQRLRGAAGAAHSPVAAASFGLACCALLGQFAALRYDPAAQLPTAADRRANEALVAQLRATPGEVFIPYHSYLALLADKAPYAHYTALAELRGDYGGGRSAPQWAALRQELGAAIQQQRFALIVLDEEWPKEGLNCCYTREALAYAPPTALVPVTGWGTRPLAIYRPRARTGVPALPSQGAPAAATASAAPPPPRAR